jgi:hypothetical protein
MPQNKQPKLVRISEKLQQNMQYVDELMERPADNAEDGNALQNSVLTKVRELDVSVTPMPACI